MKQLHTWCSITVHPRSEDVSLIALTAGRRWLQALCRLDCMAARSTLDGTAHVLRLRRCWCALRRRGLPQRQLSPPTCRHRLTELSIIACYTTLIGRRCGSDGRLTGINGRWLIFARAHAYWSWRIFSEAPSATPGVNPLRLSRDFKRVRGDYTTPCTTVVNRTPESCTEPTIHVFVRWLVLRSLDAVRRVPSRLTLSTT